MNKTQKNTLQPMDVNHPSDKKAWVKPQVKVRLVNGQRIMTSSHFPDNGNVENLYNDGTL